jgi:tol-pal system protein YbgF
MCLSGVARRKVGNLFTIQGSVKMFTPRLLLLTVLVFALFTVPAHAQRAVSLADRVAALEQQAANDRGNTDLVNQLIQMRSEIAELRGLVEQLQNENEQLKQRNRDQYLDLDSRLSRLEAGTPSLPSPDASAQASTTPAPPATTNTVAPAASAQADANPAAQTGDERSAYDVAFNALKAGNYADSAKAFADFLQQYPSGTYAPNALYWLGESYYATGNYQLAAVQFNAVLNRYPIHDKAAGALLKRGLSEYGLGKVDQAVNTLNEVIRTYPGSDVARTADDRLRSIQLGSSIR